MTHHKTVALIGGTGKAGKYLLKQLLFQNFNVKLLHRKPETLTFDDPLIQVTKGDARDYDAIHALLAGCTAVLSCLSQPVGEPPIFSEATSHILKAMNAQGIRRYITTAGLNVDTPADNKSPQTKAGTKWMYDNFPKTTADRQVEYELLAASSISWTMVRLPLITQTDETGPITVSLTDCPGNNISAANSALFMISQIDSGDFTGKAPFIADR
jgi:putative NADH-flavin reductase